MDPSLLGHGHPSAHPSGHADVRVAVAGSGPRSDALTAALAVAVPGVRLVEMTDADLDGVLLVAAYDGSGDVVATFTAAGVSVVVDPRLVGSPAQAQALVDADAGRGLVRVGWSRRHDPRFRELREHLRDDAVGDVRLVRAVDLHDPAEEGPSGLAEALDTLVWLLDDPVADVRLERLGAVLLATVRTSGGRTLDLELGPGADGAGSVRWEVVGTTGSAELRSDGAWLAEADRILLTAWVRSLRPGTLAGAVGVGASAADGFAAAQGAAAGLASLASGEPVGPGVLASDPPHPGRPDPRPEA